MPTSSFGSPSNRLSWVASGPGPSSAIPLPSGRQLANGDRSVMVTGVNFWASGRGANPRGRAYIGPHMTPELVLPSSGQADERGFQPIGPFFANGGEATLRLGWLPIFYAWGGDGSTWDGYSLTRSGRLAGGLLYQESPRAPVMLSISGSADGRTAYPRFSYAGTTDTGGAPVSGYLLQWATDPNFTRDLGYQLIPSSLSAGQPTVAGLTPGRTYWFRVTARTGMTDAAGQLGGEWSAAIGVTMQNPGQLGRINTPTGWVQADGRMWDGSGWREVNGRIWDGAAWRDLGN